MSMPYTVYRATLEVSIQRLPISQRDRHLNTVRRSIQRIINKIIIDDATSKVIESIRHIVVITLHKYSNNQQKF